MSFLQSLTKRDDRFYVLLRNSAGEAHSGAVSLGRLASKLNGPSVQEIMEEIDRSRARHKDISREIVENLFEHFVTPLDREDVETLSNALYKISKSIEKIGQRLIICPPGIDINPIQKQISLLEQGTALLSTMMERLPGKHAAEPIRDDYERIQAIEGKQTGL